MRRTRRAKGVCAFEVDKDVDAAMLDLREAGLRIYRSLSYSADYEYAEALLDEAQNMLGSRVEKYVYSTEICYFRNRKVYCRFYYDPNDTRIVKAVLIVSFSRGLLSILSRRLEALGWHRIMFFEIAKTPHGRYMY